MADGTDDAPDGRVLVVYGSTKGRTGRIAAAVAESLREAGLDVTAKNAFEVRPSDLLDYPYVVLGSSTYGQGDLQKDFLDLERGMDDLDLDGRKAAVFGSGNSRYAAYAGAVDILEAKVKILGARLLLPSLRQDMMDSAPEGAEVRAWAERLAAAVRDDLARRGRTVS